MIIEAARPRELDAELERSFCVLDVPIVKRAPVGESADVFTRSGEAAIQRLPREPGYVWESNYIRGGKDRRSGWERLARKDI